MGSGASSQHVETLAKASEDELRVAFDGLSAEDRAKLLDAVSAPQEEQVELSFVLDELFKCFDADQDDQIEREEYLACWEQLSTILDESFGPKQRKEKMTWFKEAGAEGKPTDGMYLSKEKWRLAFVASAAAESSIAAEKETALGTWVWKTYGKKLVQVFFPAAKPEVPAGIADVPSGPRPEYPMKIPLTALANKIEEARNWGLRPLVLGSGCSEVDTFLKYKIPDSHTMESSSVFVKKKSELRDYLKRGMEYEGLCAPILLKTGDAAADIKKSCCDDFPADVFNASLWTPKAACEQGFITEAMLAKLEADPAKWKDFYMLIYSELSLADARTRLSDKIPHFDSMALIEVDPESVAK